MQTPILSNVSDFILLSSLQDLLHLAINLREAKIGGLIVSTSIATIVTRGLVIFGIGFLGSDHKHETLVVLTIIICLFVVEIIELPHPFEMCLAVFEVLVIPPFILNVANDVNEHVLHDNERHDCCSEEESIYQSALRALSERVSVPVTDREQILMDQ